MKRLYAPWRSPYSKRTDRAKQEDANKQECIFCEIVDQPDEGNFVLKRLEHCFVMLNRYPYNAGHLLIVPYNHVPDLAELSAPARAQIMEQAHEMSQLVKNELGCHGINIGINIGKAAGAGIPSHLHMHILPRYHGDTNFLPIFGDTKLVSFDLNEMYQKLKQAIELTIDL